MLTERTVFKKQEFEYKSADGDIFIITYVESSGHKYIQIGREGQDEKEASIWDAEMLLDIADCLRTINKPVSPKNVKTTSGGRPSLHAPVVTDFRETQKIVNTTMNNLDETVQPLHSLQHLPDSKESWSEARTGVPIIQGTVPDTPEAISNPAWQDDVKNRINRQSSVPKELKIKRVSSGDLI